MSSANYSEILDRIAYSLARIADALEEIQAAVPTSSEILDAIERGATLCENPIYGSQVLAAIADGTREALEPKR